MILPLSLSITANAAQLDDALNRIAAARQLDQTRYQKMVSTYEAVNKLIENDEDFFKNVALDLYPQGSVRTETSVKPLKNDEFDLDCVLHIRLNHENHDPFSVFKHLKRVLSSHGTYRDMMEVKSRVIRLNYAGDFHMDIMVGCQESWNDEDRIMVPDRKLYRWVSSNPRGYAKWFNQRVDSVQEFLLEKAFSASKEPLPTQTPYALKKPLVRAVQLIKIFRDIYFQDRPNDRTSSIILTTLAGQFYKGEGTIYQTIDHFVQAMEKLLKKDLQEVRILNPSNKKEDFSDKWRQKPHLFNSFVEFLKDFKEQWKDLKREANIGQNERKLKDLFGEQMVNKALNEQKAFTAAFYCGASSPNRTFLGLRDLGGLYNIASKSKPYANGN